MSDLQRYLEEQMQNSEFKAEHDATQTEFEVMQALIAARIQANMTQAELSERSGVRQSNISRIENGMCLPTLDTLKALADGLNKKLVIRFE